MPAAITSQGTWIHRFAIRLFTIVLAVLIFWLLRFLVQDIRTIQGPDFATVEEQYVDRDLLARRAACDQQLTDLTRQIEHQQQKQRVVGDSSRNLQQTISQLLELQTLGLEKNLAFSESDQANFSSSLQVFLENQRKYQELSQTEAEMLDQKQRITDEREHLDQEINRQREPAREQYRTLADQHGLKLAALQLAMLVPLLAVAAVLLIKQRTSIYFPLFLAFGTATLVKVALVIHEYFPSRYVKYVLIGALLLVVAGLLVYVIRSIAFPKTQWLLNRYREAYERFLCPICDYPIRVGPRRFLFWTRRTVNKVLVSSERGEQEEIYTCPSCGTRLYEECTACHKVRPALLPHCSHCGNEKTLA